MTTIQARFIIQIAGKPVENVEKALNFIEKKLKEDSKFKVKESEIIEAELDEETTLYSGLIETLIKFDSIQDILDFIVAYTPNSVQIEDPESIKMDAASLTNTLNDFSIHMLRYANQVRMLNAKVHELQGGKAQAPKKESKKKK